MHIMRGSGGSPAMFADRPRLRPACKPGPHGLTLNPIPCPPFATAPQVHGRIRRYTSPDENAFFPEELPPLVLPPITYEQVR